VAGSLKWRSTSRCQAAEIGTVLAFIIKVTLVHGGIMSAQSLQNPEHIGHLWGDVSALFLVAIILGLLTPRGSTALRTD
jgi:hypothetical protein